MDASIVAAHLAEVYGGAAEAGIDGTVVISARRDRFFDDRRFPLGRLDEAVEFALESNYHGKCVYRGNGLSGEPLGGPRPRGIQMECPGITALTIDVDTREGKHKTETLCDTSTRALDLADSVLGQATITLSTGGGLLLVYLYKSPYRLDDTDSRRRVKGLHQRVQRHLRAAFAAAGYEGVDGTSDLLRLCRIPGLVNHKYDPPREVTVLRSSSRRMTEAEWEQLLPPAPQLHPVDTVRRVVASNQGKDQFDRPDLARYSPWSERRELKRLRERVYSEWLPSRGRHRALNTAAYVGYRFSVLRGSLSATSLRAELERFAARELGEESQEEITRIIDGAFASAME